ncbi:MAG: helicase-related protein [Shewanella psychromarinicola]|uniref:helicase-related protein n=1 Tax=Shewanella psychromarinicola TaxID=2487742 RepID=UPI0030017477
MSLGSEIRDGIIFKTLKEELVGPCPYGDELDIEDQSDIPYEKFNLPYICKSNQEEILKIYPTQRYGMGVLYPVGTMQEIIPDNDSENEVEIALDEEVESLLPEIKYKATMNEKESGNEFDISLTNSRAPSSIGLSFLLDKDKSDKLKFEVTGAFYKDFIKSFTKDGKTRKETWWKREPIAVELTKTLGELGRSFTIKLSDFTGTKNNPILDGYTLEGVIRPYKKNLIVTVAIVNRHPDESFKERNQKSLFQSKLNVCTPATKDPAILPYPEPMTSTEDDLSNRLLYRNAPVFGKGHGISCEWNAAPYSEVCAVSEVFTEILPTFETPSISAEIDINQDGNNEKLEIFMESLSEFRVGSSGDVQITKMIDSYTTWIENQEKLIESIPGDELKLQARKHVEKCFGTLKRIKVGYGLICSDPKVCYSFKLANKAMLEQQRHSPKRLRPVTFNSHGHVEIITPYQKNIGAKGIWRPFQIGFLLMCIEGCYDKKNPDHNLVDLIWFPTGGGKTEAYLGLAAFTLIYERLCNNEHSDGVQVLMRYTLRLLTAQQLQRAATLICCLDVIRQQNRLPGKRFSIGLWVGGKNTPNKRKQALTDLKSLKTNASKSRNTDNPFLLDRCPYCAAQLGLVTVKGYQKSIVGYKADKTTKSVIFCCTDNTCVFHHQIPVFVIDEDIYDERPSMVIGTVDKFAMLAWQPKIRSLFGIDSSGKRFCSPPQLIIQDELHLISGPLGSMVALYEPLIEKLCTEDDNGIIIKPKIVCATATTKGYQEQVENIYGRRNVAIFPPLALSAEDSFFAKYARDEDKVLLPGRKYVGVCAPGLGSILTTQVRTHSALLFAANRVEIEHRDPWVTLLSFYNSIRELGGALTLFQSDIISYLLEQKRRYPREVLPRKVVRGMELTSRLKDDEIPKAITDLEQSIDLKDITSSFYNSIVSELIILTNKFPLLAVETKVIVDNISLEGKINLRNYHCIEKINLFLRNQKPSIKLPTSCRKLYNLYLNYNIQSFCLASSIIEVGVDIDRLSLMTIVGQPKTTAQYIQVSGRVGRKNDERPGLVVTIYNNSKPRDKSHFEDFRGYHQRLYAKVEPASVTPFSKPALKRGLAAITIANIRQFSSIDATPENVNVVQIEEWRNEFLMLREEFMNEDEKQDVLKFFNNLISNWKKVTQNLNTWGSLKPDSEPSQTDLLYPLGSTNRYKGKLACPTSMRNVDGEASMWISDVYHETDLGDWDE